MTSQDLEIGYHKLDTEFFNGHVRHTTFQSDASRGRRRVAVETDWYRDRELGRGGFGTVFLERSGTGECRAVKDIAKDRNSRVVIDYRRELMAMARLAKHDALFVQLRGWYESDNYVHIAMEYISRGDLHHYLEVERSESEAKAITGQLLEGLLVIHQEGFAHRDLKPENIFVVSTSPVWVKIGDFGLAKLARNGTAFRTEGGTWDYVAPEAGIDTSRETSEYTNAIDIWALGCITHKMLTQTLPFRSLREISVYCSCPKLSRDIMVSKKISQGGIDFVERALAYPPECRITAKEALDLEWVRTEDKYEYELLKLLGDYEALSEEVAMGLIRNLKIPPPSSQTLAEKEVLFPAYLINLITSEMWNNGFIKESKRFLTKVMRSIQNEVMLKAGDDAINHDAFWLSNVHEILSFVSLAGSWRETQKDDHEFDLLLQTVKRELGSLELNIYHTWMIPLKGKLQRMAVSAIIESQSLPGFITNDGNMFQNRTLTPSSQQFTMDDLLSLFSKVYKVLQGYFIEESTVTQAVTELLKLVGVTAFNGLLIRKNFSSWKRGLQIGYNLVLLEEWCIFHGVPKDMLQLDHLVQATKLLQLKKATHNDVAIIQDICWMLTPNQIQKLLSQYQLADSEQPVNEELMKAVTPRVTAGDDALLLQAVDLDSRPYEIAEPRTSIVLGAYIPSHLRTNRLRRIADILWTRAQTQAKTKRLAAGGVESEGGMNLPPIPAELEPVHD